MVRSVWSLISPRSRRSMTAARCAAITPRWISSCSIRSWRRSAVSSGSSVARCCVRSCRARLEPVEQRLVGRPDRPGPRDLVEARLVGRGTGDASPRRRRARRRRSVAQRTTARQRQALADERDEDDREGHQQDQVALREVGGQRQRRGQRDGAAQPGPADDERQALGRRRGSRRAMSCRGELGRRLLAKTHTKRATTTTPAIEQRETERARLADRPLSASRIVRQLQPDEHEHEAVEDEADHLPGGQPQDPAAWASGSCPAGCR